MNAGLIGVDRVRAEHNLAHLVESRLAGPGVSANASHKIFSRETEHPDNRGLDQTRKPVCPISPEDIEQLILAIHEILAVALDIIHELSGKAADRRGVRVLFCYSIEEQTCIDRSGWIARRVAIVISAFDCVLHELIEAFQVLGVNAKLLIKAVRVRAQIILTAGVLCRQLLLKGYTFDLDVVDSRKNSATNDTDQG